MKKKTPNIEHRTSNIERSDSPILWRGTRIAEESAEYAGRGNRRFNLEDRLLQFAVSIVELTEAIPNTRAGNHLAGQLLRSGTSPYGHHGEVESAESKKDFVHKLKVCLKELRETMRWLRLLSRLKTMVTLAELRPMLAEVDELIRIFVASVRTAERRGP